MKPTVSKLFKAFLKNEGAYEAFKSAIREEGIYESFTYLTNSCLSESKILDVAFTWANTPDGHPYWFRLERRWIKVIKHITL